MGFLSLPNLTQTGAVIVALQVVWNSLAYCVNGRMRPRRRTVCLYTDEHTFLVPEVEMCSVWGTVCTVNVRENSQGEECSVLSAVKRARACLCVCECVRVCFGREQFFSWPRNCHLFMEHEGTLLYSQQAAILSLLLQINSLHA